MKKIVFNGCWVGTDVDGVSRYAYNLIREMDKLLDKANENIRVEVAVPSSAVTESLDLRNIAVVRIGDNKNKIQKKLWEQFSFPRYVRKNKAIGVDLTQSFPVSGVKYIAIHDCVCEVFPEKFDDNKLYRFLYLHKAKRITKNKKTRIITVSNESKKEIMKYYHVSADRISVIGNGWEHMKDIEPDYSIYDKLNIQEEYFFALGSKYKHKNLQWVMKTAKMNPHYRFILTGSNSYSKEADNLENDKPSNVQLTGFVSDGEMKALMLGCKALIQPSLYEGFGIPPLEALSLGKKIIVSDASCFPEIYGDAAYYIDPRGEGCDLDSLLKDDVSPSQDVLRKHSWAKSARELFELLTK